ncbi:MAG: protein-glutamate O-methyltransferase family protein [Chloroflexi bacterium]|nr:protein-glutamate O-methyltransferase family protein [Chloroflexota bacterium]
MTTYELPTPLLDPDTFPPLIYTSEPHSFAYNTFKKRIPAILRETMAVNDFPHHIQRNLEDLHQELTDGRIRLLQEDTPDRTFWDEVSQPFVGRTWLDVPWFWAEAFFYRRLLEAIRYFHPGPTHLLDPFLPIKRREWQPQAAPRTLNQLLSSLPPDRHGCFERFFHAALWGNRVDLSYNVAGHLGSNSSKQAEQANLLADDSKKVWAHLRQNRGTIIYVTDNAGTELLMDLALSNFLLDSELAKEVHMHVKPQPYYVSDAMAADVAEGIQALPQGGKEATQLAEAIQRQIDKGRFQISSHWFYASSLFFYQLPADLLAQLSTAALVIVKGDANYRRLLGDAHWPYTTPFEHILRYFPAPVVALRTFKAELAVGLAPGKAEQIAQQDPDWLVNGRRGVIQARLFATS